MIIGDPFDFALQFEIVKVWNAPDDVWKNGLFSLYISGRRVFGCVDVFELTTTFGFYHDAPVETLSTNNLVVGKEVLYQNAEDFFMGDGEELIGGLFDMTCTAMGDNGVHLYFIKTVSGDRLVWSVDNGISVSEAMLAPGTVAEVIQELRACSL
ncbi:MAG TPA: hypothetical protein DCF43_03485 [Pseudomonas sp.]|nr:hypothetical protein [Pseudomonas sp.]